LTVDCIRVWIGHVIARAIINVEEEILHPKVDMAALIRCLFVQQWAVARTPESHAHLSHALKALT
jgi:hypothetical protein